MGQNREQSLEQNKRTDVIKTWTHWQCLQTKKVWKEILRAILTSTIVSPSTWWRRWKSMLLELHGIWCVWLFSFHLNGKSYYQIIWKIIENHTNCLKYFFNFTGVYIDRISRNNSCKQIYLFRIQKIIS